MPFPKLSKSVWWKFKSRSTTISVTTGASSATQTLNSTAGLAAGDTLYIGGATKALAFVSSVTNATVVVLTVSVSTTTGDPVTLRPAFNSSTVTTGANSATQTLGSTAGFAAGDTIFIGGATQMQAQVLSITSATVLVLTASVSTTTADLVTRLPPQHPGMILQTEDSTPGTKVFSILDDTGVEQAYITREGGITGTLIQGAQGAQSMASSTAIALTSGKSFYPVVGNGGAVVTVTVPTLNVVPGTIITLNGTDATNTVRIDDNSTGMRLTANLVLGLHDTLTLIFDGVNWCEVARAING